MSSRSAAFAIVALALAPAAAGAEATPTLAQSLVIADNWAARAAPGVPNHCSGGRLKISWDASIPSDVMGYAQGWVLGSDATYRWDHAKCDVSIKPSLSPALKCWTIAHELMHFVIGPDHVGPLSLKNPGASTCFEETKRQAVVETIRKVLPIRSWRVNCNPRVSRCVARAPRTRPRYFVVVSRTDVRETSGGVRRATG